LALSSLPLATFLQPTTAQTGIARW